MARASQCCSVPEKQELPLEAGAEQERAEQERAEQERAEQERAERERAERERQVVRMPAVEPLEVEMPVDRKRPPVSDERTVERRAVEVAKVVPHPRVNQPPKIVDDR